MWIERYNELPSDKFDLDRYHLQEVEVLASQLADQAPEGDIRLVGIAGGEQLFSSDPNRDHLAATGYSCHHPEAGGEFTPVDQLHWLLVRLSENWARFRIFDWQEGVPWTNNPTEQVIGKMKMRARTVRGYKTWPGMASGLMVSGVGIA